MSKNTKIIVALILVCVVMTVIPFVISSGSKFGGADDAAGAIVEELSPGYEPWAAPILETILGGELPGETESLLFCLQAAIGSGILFYCFGFLVARKKYLKEG
ncbi:energy-coupling factor ABC transporter substrate-binding protein [Candidatus Galacturonibacter soehngenii]|uniref:Cobalt transport protein CbiN n=1 Tax=Candidatus Galacturonatibacter soehngenii TaxID=2307010 RepID=A0A7V7QN34_9FIRM|nr:energy-coupling factor ABC transporter substrate-binding protein [Candidatus Galacturonibacter soehngenii]KAB1440063.1 energy-coupling factor ABC transporter substrate-binding protein [Candidatus Galacturonibacter soehngenii]MBA4686113.1 energy-coupling factor ABC transporter substrate-binding protein [Candidatus Galacturonibacter soehngenii]